MQTVEGDGEQGCVFTEQRFPKGINLFEKVNMSWVTTDCRRETLSLRKSLEKRSRGCHRISRSK